MSGLDLDKFLAAVPPTEHAKLSSLVSLSVSFPNLSLILGALLSHVDTQARQIETLMKREERFDRIEKDVKESKEENLKAIEGLRVSLNKMNTDVEALRNTNRLSQKQIDEQRKAIESAAENTEKQITRLQKEITGMNTQFKSIEEIGKEQEHINRRFQFSIDALNKTNDDAKSTMSEIYKSVRETKTDVLIVEGKLADLGNPRFRLEGGPSSRSGSVSGAHPTASNAQLQSLPQHPNPLINTSINNNLRNASANPLPTPTSPQLRNMPSNLGPRGSSQLVTMSNGDLGNFVSHPGSATIYIDHNSATPSVLSPRDGGEYDPASAGGGSQIPLPEQLLGTNNNINLPLSSRDMPSLHQFELDQDLAAHAQQQQRNAVSRENVRIEGPLFSLDRFGQVDTWGASASRELQTGPSDTLGKVFHEAMVHPAASDKVHRAIEGVLQEGTPQPPIVVPIRRSPVEIAENPDAPDHRDVQVVFEPRRDLKSNAVTGVVAQGQAYLMQTPLDRALVATSSRDTGDLLVVDKSGRIVYWSPTAAHMTGLFAHDAVNRILFTDFVDRHNLAEVRKVVDLVLAGRTNLSLVLPLSINGRITKFKCDLTTSLDDKGRVSGVRFVAPLTVTDENTEALKAADVIAKNSRSGLSSRHVGVPYDVPSITAYNAALAGDGTALGMLQQQGGGGSSNNNQRGGGSGAVSFSDQRMGPIISVDRHGRIDRWSNTAEQLTGVLESAASGRRLVDEFVPENMWPELQSAFTMALRGQEARNVFLPLSSGPFKASLHVNFIPRDDGKDVISGVIIEGMTLPSAPALSWTELNRTFPVGTQAGSADASTASSPPLITRTGSVTKEQQVQNAAKAIVGTDAASAADASAAAAASSGPAGKKRAKTPVGATAAPGKTVLDAKLMNQLAQMQEVLSNHARRHEVFEETMENEKKAMKSISALVLKKADASAVAEQLQSLRELIESSITNLSQELTSEKEILRTTAVQSNRITKEIKLKANRSEVAKLQETLKQTAASLEGHEIVGGIVKPIVDAKCISCHRTLPEIVPYRNGHVPAAALHPKDHSLSAKIALERDKEGRKNEYYPGFSGGTSPRTKSAGFPKMNLDDPNVAGTVVMTGGHGGSTSGPASAVLPGSPVQPVQPVQPVPPRTAPANSLRRGQPETLNRLAPVSSISSVGNEIDGTFLTVNGHLMSNTGDSKTAGINTSVSGNNNNLNATQMHSGGGGGGGSADDTGDLSLMHSTGLSNISVIKPEPDRADDSNHNANNASTSASSQQQQQQQQQ